MGITNWFINNLDSEERILTRDLLSVAIADKEFSEEERKTILEICMIEDISNVELMNSIRNQITTSNALVTQEDKKRYLLNLIRVMSADKNYYPLEMHIIEILAKKIGIPPLKLVLFLVEEIKDKNISQYEGLDIIEEFVRHLIVTGE
jgi:uncharacterized tellurite resistance protein B-like protein